MGNISHTDSVAAVGSTRIGEQLQCTEKHRSRHTHKKKLLNIKTLLIIRTLVYLLDAFS